MTTSQISLDAIEAQIAHAVETADARSREEQLDLLTDLLAEAFNASRVEG